MRLLTSPRLFRDVVSVFFFLVFIQISGQFLIFLATLSPGGAPLVPRPAAIEAFLPISALLGLRYWLATGQYDPVHPAGLSILLAAVVASFFFSRSFCAVVCPFGTMGLWLSRLGARLRKPWRVPGKLDAGLRLLKYVLLALSLKTFLLSMDTQSVAAFLFTPYNFTADARLASFFLSPSALVLCILAVVILASLFLKSPFCRWLCPYGALLSVFSLAGPSKIKRDQEHCTACGRCSRSCPMDVPEPGLTRVPECIGCGQCVAACPEDRALEVRFFGLRQPVVFCLAAVVLVFLVLPLAAKAFGVWDGQMSPNMLKRLYLQG